MNANKEGLMLKTIASACVLAVLAFTSTTVHAQTLDNRTFFTFSQPVTLPGVTLPAGKYLFRNPDVTASRRVVQVLSDDGKRSYAMLLTIPAQRTEPSAQPEIRFMETAEGTPAAIKAWWYPGNTIGWEFIYPKEQALRLAKAASSPVLTTASAQNDTTEEMKTADLARVSESGTETSVTVEEKPAATAVAGTQQEGQLAASTIQIPSTPTPVATTGAQVTSTTSETKQASVGTTARSRTRLPQTGSSAPALALLGVGMLAMGTMLFRWPRLRV
jgi:LPXTG-motif cell wall-anchored protein